MATQIKFVDKDQHHLQHITYLGSDALKWTRGELVNLIDSGRESFFTHVDGKSAWIETVHPGVGQPYVKTKADNTLKDNLLSLPACPSTLRRA